MLTKQQAVRRHFKPRRSSPLLGSSAHNKRRGEETRVSARVHYQSQQRGCRQQTSLRMLLHLSGVCKDGPAVVSKQFVPTVGGDSVLMDDCKYKA